MPNGVSGYQIIRNDSGAIASQDRVVSGVTHKRILRGPCTVPTGSVGPTSLISVRYPFSKSRNEARYYTWPAVPTAGELKTYLEDTVALMDAQSPGTLYGVGLGLHISGYVTYIGGGYQYGFRHTASSVDGIHGVTTIWTAKVPYRKITSATLTINYTGTLKYSLRKSAITTPLQVNVGTELTTTTIDITEALDEANRNGENLYIL